MVEGKVIQTDDNVHVIHSIYGGPNLNGELSNSHKIYAREECKEVLHYPYNVQWGGWGNLSIRRSISCYIKSGFMWCMSYISWHLKVQ